MKLDWKKTLLIGLGFFGISVMWQLYNTFVPIFLQAGSATFAGSAHVRGFGLTATTTGLIMGLDNLAAIFILPLIGIWSDRIRTPIGRRYPFILTAAPLAAIAFVLMPIASSLIGENGQIAGNGAAFALFIVGAGGMLLAMAILRTPVISLMPDLTPPTLRSKANGIINFMGGIGFIVASFGLGSLFDVNALFPFIGGSAILLIAVVALFLSVKEPRPEDLAPDSDHETSEEEQALGALQQVKVIPAAYRRSLIFLLVAIFAWFVAYDGVSTFFSSYAVNVLGVTEGAASRIFTVAGAAFLVFAIPAGFIGERLGRRRTIILGLAVFATLLFVGNFVNSVPVIVAILGIGGLGWALVNINSLPMVVDTTDDARLLGTYTGLYYLASQTGSALAPAITGGIVDLLGRQYRAIFLTGPAFFVIAILCMLLVTRGEAHQTEQHVAATR